MAVVLCSEAVCPGTSAPRGVAAGPGRSVRAQRVLQRWLSGGALPPGEACASVPGGRGRGPPPLPGPALRPPVAPLVGPSPSQALFAFRDPAPTPPSPPPPLGLAGPRAGLLGLGAPSWLRPEVVLTAVGPPILRGAEGCRVLVLLAEGVGAEVAEGSGGFATHVTVVPRALPLPCKESECHSPGPGLTSALTPVRRAQLCTRLIRRKTS